MAVFNVELRERVSGQFTDLIYVKSHWNILEGIPSTFTPVPHTHGTSDIPERNHHVGSWGINVAGQGYDFTFSPAPPEADTARILVYQNDLEGQIQIKVNGVIVVAAMNAPDAVTTWVYFDVPTTSFSKTGNNTLRIEHNGTGTADWGTIYEVVVVYGNSVDAHNHDDRYYTESESNNLFLGKTAKAADSDKLDGFDSKDFALALVNDGTTGLWHSTNANVTEYVDGLAVVLLVNGISGSSGGTKFEINNLGSYNIYYTDNSVLTTHYSPNTVVVLSWDADQSRWYCHDFYYSTEDYNMRWENSVRLGAATGGYQLLLEGTDGKMYPITNGGDTPAQTALSTITNMTLKIGGKILYYNSGTNLAANAVTANIYEGEYSGEMEYWSNKASAWATAYQPFYLVVQLQSDGSYKVKGANTQGTDYLTQTLPTTDDGYLYIQIGFMQDTWDAWRLQIDHPIYQFKEGKLRLYIPEHNHDASDINAGTLNLDRLPTIPQNKVSNLETDLASRVPFSLEKTLSITTNDWVTIATASTARALGEFIVYDDSSGKHNVAQFIASTSYGKMALTWLHGNRYGTRTIAHVRLLYNIADPVYGGAKLQVYCENPTFNLRVRKKILGDVMTGWNYFSDITPVVEGTPSGWAEYTRIDDITNYTLKHILSNDARLSDARPASDVSSWAKESSKPSYVWSEIGSKPVFTINRLLLGAGNDTPTTIALGASGQVLKGTGGLPTWGTVAASEVSGLGANYRWLTDALISAWNNKQDALGFTPVTNARTIGGINLVDDITNAELTAAINEATTNLKGAMSAVDKIRLDTLYALLNDSTDGSADSIVDTIQDILAIFSTYPEGADMVTALAGKVNITDVAETNTASKIVKRNSSGDIITRLFRSEYTSPTTTPNYVMVQHALGVAGADNYIRPITLANFKTSLGSMPASDVYTWAKAATKPTYDKTEIGLSNVPNVDTSDPSNITQNASYRFVTDTEKTTWDSKLSSVPNDHVTNARLANMAASTVKGRATQSTGDPEDITMSQLKTLLALVKGDVGLGNVDNTADASKYVAGVKQTRDSANTLIWHGTQAQYNAIGTKSSNTLYFITA